MPQLESDTFPCSGFCNDLESCLVAGHGDIEHRLERNALGTEVARHNSHSRRYHSAIPGFLVKRVPAVLLASFACGRPKDFILTLTRFTLRAHSSQQPLEHPEDMVRFAEKQQPGFTYDEVFAEDSSLD